jgi:hypothetical protein
VMGRVLDFLGLCLGSPFDTKIVSPPDGSAFNEVPSFEGIAMAGAETDLDRVEVQVRRASDGSYWTGGGWTAAETWVAATGTDAWSYVLPTSLQDSDYRLRARAWTTDGYSDTTPDEVVFTFDTTPPASTVLITPTDGVTISAVAGVTLVWQPVGPAGGTSIAYVMQLDGRPYTTTQSTYTVTSIDNGPHTWGVQAFDVAGNRSAWVMGSFSVSRQQVWLPLVMRGFAGGQECGNVLVNGGFESDVGWALNQLATYDTVQVHSGVQSARIGIPPGEPGSDTYSSVAQTVVLPAGASATLRLWVYPIREGDDPGDWHYVGLHDQSDVYHALDHWQSDARAWGARQYSLNSFIGQTVTLYIGVRNDGDDDTAALYVDDVVLEICQ